MQTSPHKPEGNRKGGRDLTSTAQGEMLIWGQLSCVSIHLHGLQFPKKKDLKEVVWRLHELQNGINKGYPLTIGEFQNRGTSSTLIDYCETSINVAQMFGNA